MPIFSLPIALILIREKPAKEEVLGLVIATLGLAIYSLPLLEGFRLDGAILTLTNAVFWAAFTVYYRKMKDMDPITVNTSQLLIGGVLLLIISPFFGATIAITTREMVDLAFVSTLGGSVTFLLWNLMMKYEKVNRVTVASYSIPIFTTVLQLFTSGDLPTIYSISGLGLMTFGVIVSRVKGGIGKVRPKSGMRIHKSTSN
jgi:drug/metabolite transporter (DMT)-like permease